MHTRQLLLGSILSVLGAAGCSRADTDENARRAAAEVRDIAAQARHQLADSWLTTKIQAQYFADKDIKARYLDVSTRDGIVRIKGQVDSEALREQVVNIARYTDGVRDIEDQLTVGQTSLASSAAETEGAGALGTADTSASSRAVGTAGIPPAAVPPMDDERITTTIQAKYFLNDAVKQRRIDVDTRNRVVTLRGEVANDNERAQALLMARTTEGVDRVEDALAVNPALTPAAGVGSIAPPQAPTAADSQDAALTEQVRSRLMSDAQLKAASIDVTAKDGVLLVEGTVPTPAARQRALFIARQTEGVVQVVDRLTVK